MLGQIFSWCLVLTEEIISALAAQSYKLAVLVALYIAVLQAIQATTGGIFDLNLLVKAFSGFLI